MGTNALDPATVRGVARALYVPTRAVWLAVGESLGLDVWRTDDDLPAMFPPGLPVLKQRHWDVLLPLMQMLVEDAEREDQLTAIAAAAEEPAEETKPARRPTRRTRAAKES